MRHSLRRLGTALALALAACAKQQPLPVANFLGITQDKLTVATGQQIVLDASNSVDPSGTGLSWEWSFVSLPAGSRAKIESPHNAKTRFTADVPTSPTEQYVLSLVVKNQYYLSVPHQLVISALECGASAPQINSITAAPTSINISTPVLLTAAVDDKDNDAVCQASLGNVKQTEKYRWDLTALPAGSRAHLRDPGAVLAAFDPDIAGTYTATLTVTDSTGRSSDPAHVDVQVAACGGAAPGINSVTSSPASPDLDQPTQLTADVSDADNNPICGLKQVFSYSWSAVAVPQGSTAQLNDPTAVNPSFTPDVPGEYGFALVVTDSTGLRSAPMQQPFLVQAKPCGGAPPTPIVQFIPASAGIGLPVSLKVTPQDADAACGISETFSYAWSLVAVPGGSTAQIASADASAASLVPDVGGDYAINVTITDSRGTSASALTHLTVAPCGSNAPSVDVLAGLPLTPLVGQNVHVTAQVSDADSACVGYNPAQTFRWTMSTRPAGSAAALKDPTARAADFVPDVIGHYQLTLVVTDATGRSSAPALFDVQTSTCGKSAPQIVSVGASSYSPDPGTPFTLFAQTLDPDNGGSCNLGQTVSLRWYVSSRPAGSSATLSDPAAATPSFTADVPGSFQFSVVATDSTGLHSPPSFLTLGTTTCGTAIPTVTAVPSNITVQPFQAVTLSATPFDADTSCGINQTFTYAWTVVSAPAGSNAMLSNPGAAAPSITPDTAGTYLVSVTVADSHGHVSPAAFVTVIATGCATLPPITGPLASGVPALGLPVTLSAPSARATACGATAALQYSWSLSGPAGSAAVLDNPAAAAPSFVPNMAGSYQAALVVRDSHGLASTKSVLNLGVAGCATSHLAWNAAPELTPSFTEPDKTSLAATFASGVWTGAFVGTSITMGAGFVDPPGCGIAPVQPFAYQWALVSLPSGSAAHLDSGTSAMPSFVPDLPGDYQVAARVSDAMGAVLPTRFATLHVPGCGSTLPVVAIAPPASTTVNTLQTLHLTVAGGTATDADNGSGCPARLAPGTNFSYAWSVSPAGASLAATAGAATDFTAAAPGRYTAQLVATAANGLKSLPATLALTAGTCGSHPPQIASVTTTVGGAPASRPQVGKSVTVTAFAIDPDASCGDLVASYAWTLVSAPAGSLSATAPGALASFSFVPDVAGAYQYTVVATDTTGLTSAPYTISLQTATCAPSVASITPSIGGPATNQPFTLTAAAPADSCVPAPSFAYAWRVVSAPRGSVAMLSSLTSASTSFTADVAGAYQFAVTATDQAGFSSAPATVVISAGTCGTNLPQLDPIASSPSSFNAGDLLLLSSALHDLNGACGALTQPYRWQWTLLSRPAGSVAALASGDATPAFVPDLPGSYQISAQATDALGNVSAAVFTTLSTSSCGVNPVTASILPAPAGPQLAATINTPLALTAAVGDADNACPAAFHVTLGQQWSILTAPIGAQASLTSTTTAGTSFQANLPGTYVVGLVGTASNGLSSALATVSINAVSCGANPPSVISVTTGVSRPPVGSSVTLTANVFDQDNQPACQAVLSGLQTFTYSWRAVSVPAGASVSTAGNSKNFTFNATVAGSYVFEVVATDSAGFSSAPFRISIATAGCAPTLGSVTATGSLAVGAAENVSLSSVTDACVASSASPAYFWSLASRPSTSNASFVSPSAVANSFTPDVPGTYDIRVTVTDAGGFSGSADKVITVGGCSAGPTVTINAPHGFFGGVEVPAPFDRDDAIFLSATVSGGGCGAVAPSYGYAWSILGRPAGSTAQLDSTSAVTPSFTLDVPGGTWQVMLVVKDQLGNASTAVIENVDSSSCGARAPVIAGLPATLSTSTFQQQALSVTSADPDASCAARFSDLPISFAWSVLSKPAGAPAPSLSTVGGNAQFTANFPGAYQVQVVATGRDGVSSAPSVVAITSTQCGYNAPAIGLISGTQAAPGTTSAPFAARVDLALSASVTDADLPPTACSATTPAQTEFQQWLLTSAPAGSVAQLRAANTASPHLVPDLPGNYTVEVIASDSTGLSSSKSATFAVGTCGTHAPVAAPLTASQPLPGAAALHAAPFALGFPVIADAPSITDADTACGFPASFTLAWALQAAPGSAARLSNAGTAQPSFVPDVAGVYTLILTVTDTTGLSSTSSVALDVECGAAPPVALSFTASQTVASVNVSGTGAVSNFQIVRSTNAGAVVNGNLPFYPNLPVSVAATVDEGDAAACPPVEKTFSYAWSLARAPAGSTATILNPTTVTPGFVPDVAGEYDVQLMLTDSSGRSSTQVFATSAPNTPLIPVGVCGVQAPQASIGVAQPIAVSAPVALVSVPVGSAVLLDGLPSHDPNADPLQLTASNNPAGAAAVVSGCGLGDGSLSYQWTVTAVPAALQPFTLTHANLPNPSFTASVNGNYDLTLTVSNGSRKGSAPISIHARGLGSGTVTAVPANADGLLIVGTTHGANIVTTVFDTDGKPLAAIPVSVSVTAGLTGNTLSPTSGTTDGVGKFTALLTSTKAGAATKNGEVKTVSSSSGSSALGSANVAFNPGALDHLDWFVQPCNTPAGVVIKCLGGFPEVDGYDGFGNATTAYTSPVTLAVQQQPGGSTVSGTLKQNAGTPFNDLSFNQTGNYQFLATSPENLPGPTAATTGPSPGFGVFSVVFQGTLPPSNPPTVTSSTATTPRQIVINWNGSLLKNNQLDLTIKQYHVFRATGAVTPTTGTFSDIGVATNASNCGGSFSPCQFNDTSSALADGTVYTYYLEADNVGVAVGACTSSSCSGPSNVTQQFTMPGVARNLVATGGTRQVTLNWSAPAIGTSTSYDLLSGSSSGTETLSASGVSPPTVLSGLSDNQAVFYEIQTNITGSVAPATDPNSSISAEAMGLTLPGKVSGLSASPAPTYKNVSLTWTAQTGITAYTVQRGESAGSYTTSFNVLTNSFADTSVFPSVNYHYAVAAVNATGPGPTSNDLSVTTPAAPWSRASLGLSGGWLNSIVADPGNPGVLYGATGKLTDSSTGGGVFKFTPGTGSWAAVDNGIPNGVVVTSLAADTIGGIIIGLYAATNGSGVFVTVDNGITWGQAPTPGLTNTNVRAVFVDTGHTVWAGGDTAGGGGIFSLASGATSWTTTLTGPTQTVQAFAQDGTGNLWAQLSGGATATPAGGLYKLAGAAWTLDASQPSLAGAPPTDCSPTRSNASALAIDTFPTPSVIYWGSKTCGLLSRPVGGTVWSPVAGYATTEITRVALTNGPTSTQRPLIWVGSAESSVANGVTLLQPSGGVPPSVHLSNPSFPSNNWEPTALAIDPSGINNLYAGAGDGSGAYVSTNASSSTGGSFTRSNTGLSNVGVKFLVRDTSNATDLYAAGDQFGVATSTNASGAWTVQTLPATCTAPVSSLDFDTADTTLFVTCQGVQGVFVGASKGTSWTLQPCTGLPAAPVYSRGMVVVPGLSKDTLYLATQGAPATLWATDASGANIGKICTAVTPALPAAVTDVTGIAVDSAGALYAGSPGNFVETLCTGTGCGSATWVAPTTGPRSVKRFFIDTHPSPNVMYAAGQDNGTGVGGVWSGAVTGVTAATTIVWTTVPAVSPTGVTAASTVTGFNGFVVNGAPFLFAGTSFTAGQRYQNVFRNAGSNWSASADGLVGGNVLAIAIPSASSLGTVVVLAGTSGGGVFKTTSGGQ